MRRSLVFLAAATLAQPGTAGAQEAPTPPLFASDEPLRLTVAADFQQLRRDRSQESEEREGFLTLPDADGASVPLKIRTRGRTRLRSSICEFPPLRLNVPKSAVEGTVLEGQDKLKLVTHCRAREENQTNTLEEYLAYRLLNRLTERSFRVRLARVTYVDLSRREQPHEQWGFLIEDDDHLAERLGGEVMDESVEVPVRDFRGRNTALVSLFQYMIGNTDWSMAQHHNTVLVRTPADIIPVPYDFDWSGLVNASYARPDSTLGLRTVRQRAYREPCRYDIDYPALFEHFRANREALEAEVRGIPGLDEDRQAEALGYIAEFFETIDDPAKAQEEIVEGCRRA